MPKLRAEEKQLLWRGGWHDDQPGPLAWGTRVCHCHTSLSTPPGWGQRQHWPAWGGTEKSTTKHPGRWLGKPALELGSGRDVASVTMSPLGAVSPQAAGQWQKFLPGGGRAGGSSLSWGCGGTVPALNVNVGSSAEQTPRGCPVLQGRGRGGAALAHQVTIQHPPPGAPRASCARETKPTSWQPVNNKPHHEHTIKIGLKTRSVESV